MDESGSHFFMEESVDESVDELLASAESSCTSSRASSRTPTRTVTRAPSPCGLLAELEAEVLADDADGALHDDVPSDDEPLGHVVGDSLPMMRRAAASPLGAAECPTWEWCW